MDIFNKEFGVVLGGFAALMTAILSWIKWGSDITKTDIGKATSGNTAIQAILSNIVKHENVEIVSIGEVTNGGGIPEIGKPLYIKTLFSTDYDTLHVYGDKYLIGGNLLQSFSNLLINGSTIFYKDEMDKQIQTWFEAKGIKKVQHFLVGIESGKRVITMMVGYNDDVEISSEQNFDLISQSKNIKKLINDSSFFKKIIG